MSAPRLRFARRVVLAALVALALASPAYACSCGPRPSVEESRAASAAVFTGIPISIQSNADPGGNFRVTFQVTAVWKGTVGAQYSLLMDDPQMCGVSFRLGEEWLVYAFPYYAAEVYTYNCSRTARAAGNPDFEELGPPLTTPALASSWGLVKAIYR
jgi:hypothetical protein